MAGTGLIRTPDQRVRVFVSSALQELAAERRAVRDAIAGLRLVPVMFELGARPHPPQNVYRAYLAQSQVFVGIYWQSYGWVAPWERMSGLEDEYLLSAGLPRLIYVKSPAPDREPRLTEMLSRIKDDGDVAYKRFSDRAELQSLVQNDLAVLLSERFEMAQASDGLPHEPAALPLPAAVTPLEGGSGRPRRLVTWCCGKGCAWSPSLGRAEWARAGWRWRSPASSAPASPVACASSTSPQFSGPTWWPRPSQPGWG